MLEYHTVAGVFEDNSKSALLLVRVCHGCRRLARLGRLTLFASVVICVLAASRSSKGEKLCPEKMSIALMEITSNVSENWAWRVFLRIDSEQAREARGEEKGFAHSQLRDTHLTLKTPFHCQPCLVLSCTPFRREISNVSAKQRFRLFLVGGRFYAPTIEIRSANPWDVRGLSAMLRSVLSHRRFCHDGQTPFKLGQSEGCTWNSSFPNFVLPRLDPVTWNLSPLS